MKNRIISNLFVALFTQLVLVAFDHLYFNETKPLMHYVVAFVLLFILISVCSWLDMKGWNSWSKVIGLFKKKI